jgi:hypothetical protein
MARAGGLEESESVIYENKVLMSAMFPVSKAGAAGQDGRNTTKPLLGVPEGLRVAGYGDEKAETFNPSGAQFSCFCPKRVLLRPTPEVVLSYASWRRRLGQEIRKNEDYSIPQIEFC